MTRVAVRRRPTGTGARALVWLQRQQRMTRVERTGGANAQRSALKVTRLLTEGAHERYSLTSRLN
jgi:hypothetical protein